MDGENQDSRPDAGAAWRRARRSMRRLFGDLADLDDAGGIAAAAEAEAWPAERGRREVERMTLLRRMLGSAIDRIRDDT